MRETVLIPSLLVCGALAWVASERITAPEPKRAAVEITYWEKWTGFELDGIRAVVDDFNRSQDRIHVKLLTVSDLSNKLLMSVSGGVPPDVAGIWGLDIAKYADADAILPLDDYCRKFGIRQSDYIPAYWDISFYRGHAFGLPTTPASTALHYNVDLFREFGLDPNRPPRTIEELDAMSDAMTVRRKDGSLLRTGFLPSEPPGWSWSWGFFFGGRLWDGADRITANCPENVRAMKWVQSYSRRYGPAEVQTFRSGFGNFSSPQNAFMDRKVAMELQGVWMGNFIQTFAPKMHWTVAPFPYPADRPDLANTAAVDMDVIVIPRGSRRPDEAFEFIRFLESQPEMEKLCLAHKKNSPLTKVSDRFWRENANPYVRMFDRFARSKNTFAIPKLGIWEEYGAELTNAFEQIALLQKEPKEALDYVTNRMQPKLETYRKRMRQRGEAL